MGRGMIHKPRKNYNSLLRELQRNQEESHKKIEQNQRPAKETEIKPEEHDIRNALIRKAVPKETKDLTLYCEYFQKAGITTEFLKELIEEYTANLELVNRESMKLQIQDDVWIVELKGESRCRLLHNNYLVTMDKERIFKDGYHEQSIPKNSTPENAMRTAMMYSWKEHRNQR